MSRNDIRVAATELFSLPVSMRVPLKFGTGTVTAVTCARARVTVAGEDGRTASGWGETPLSVQWAWPSDTPHDERERAVEAFSIELARAWAELDVTGHPIEIGVAFERDRLPALLERFNAREPDVEPMPWLAALVCASPFDIAVHDAYGRLLGKPVYETYDGRFMNVDLGELLEPAEGARVSFAGRYPADFLVDAPRELPAWHLVGGKDPVDEGELTGDEPDDGYPVLLRDWIRRDGLDCLKIKLRGNDAGWDRDRIARVGAISIAEGVNWLTADFNCTVTEPEYVTDILDWLVVDHPRIHGMILYVEQPFPYDLEANRIDVHSVSARKPLFMDESAHDWRHVRLGRSLGWTGVALKTCKTQTGALLSLCWARAHGMTLMVQDLTNPMLAQIPHVLLAAHAKTIMGVETNASQFYPEASRPEAAIHPGLYDRRGGRVDLSTISGAGFGYRVEEIRRELPERVAGF